MGARYAVLVAMILSVAAVADAAESSPSDGSFLQADPVPGMPLAYRDQGQLSDRVRDAMRAEVARILTDAGISVDEFTREELDEGRQPVDGVLVSILVWDKHPTYWKLQENTLGVTILGETVPSVVYVFYPVVLRELGIGTKKSASYTDEEIGRALARLAVHEIVHAFCPDHKHTRWGIMGHIQGARSLTDAGATLGGSAATALVEAWGTARDAIAQP